MPQITGFPIKPLFIEEFEGLRGVLAWWVVFGHMAAFSGWMGGKEGTPLIIEVFLRGGVPVDVFITMSGFVIFFLLNNKDSGYKKYLTGRAFRLLPAYYVMLLCAILTLPLGEFAYTHAYWLEPAAIARASARYVATTDNLLGHIFLHVSMLHGLIPDNIFPYAGDSILGAAWSLSLEWQFYLLAPALCWLAQRSIPLAAGACLILLLFKLLLLHSPYTFSWGAFLPLKFEFFCLGMGSFLIYRRFCRSGHL